MENNKVKKELNNKKLITCVSDYLTVLKNEVQEVDTKNERFFRGLSNTDYVKTDFPSIYRSPDNDSKYEPYIKYEHEMFYDLVSRFPEQFSSCKNTFEHLVMMQHYGFPTRLLDITTNRLVALYFACVDGSGNVDSNNDGVVTIYDIPKHNCKNHNSDTVTILSNLSRIDEEFRPIILQYNYFKRNLNSQLDTELKFNNIEKVVRMLNAFNRLMDFEEKKIDISNFEFNACQLMEFLTENAQLYLNECENYNSLRDTYNESNEEYEDEYGDIRYHYFGDPYLEEIFIDSSSKLEMYFNNFVKSYNKLYNYFYFKENLKFKQLILEEKNYFIYENIHWKDSINVFCVRPKLNNPRILNQNGSFLLFGFGSVNDTKLVPPTQHFKLKAKKKNSKSAINT